MGSTSCVAAGMMRWHTPIGATLKNSSRRVRPLRWRNGILREASLPCAGRGRRSHENLTAASDRIFTQSAAEVDLGEFAGEIGSSNASDETTMCRGLSLWPLALSGKRRICDDEEPSSGGSFFSSIEWSRLCGERGLLAGDGQGQDALSYGAQVDQ